MIRVRTLGLALALLMSGGHASWAEEADAAPEKNGWTPAFDLSLVVFDLEATGSASNPTGGSASGTGSKTVASFRAGLNFASPEIDVGFFKPRIAIMGGLQGGPAQSVDAVNTGSIFAGQPEGDIGNVFQQNLLNNVPTPPGNALLGIGTQLERTSRGLGWYAGLGLEFPMPGAESVITLRPYAVYLGEKNRAEGQLIAAVNNSFPGLPAYAVARSSLGQVQEDFHYLGPALGVDLNLAKGDRLRVAVFATTEFLFSVGDNEMRFQENTANNLLAGSVDPANPGQVNVTTFPLADTTASYVLTGEDFRFNIQFGVRFAFDNLFGE